MSTNFADSGQYTDAQMNMRKRLADAMIKNSMETTPIQSHWQGLARLANALVGGYMSHKLGEEDKANKKAETDTFLAMFGEGPGSGSIATTPTTDSPATPKPVTSSTPSAPATGYDVNDKSVPAAIRTNNPGAMWPGPSSQKFGSTEAIDVAGGNKAAVFKDPVDGAAAQFDLMNRAYTGKTLSKAIEKWSGGNNSADYVARIARETGLDPNAPLTPEVLKSDRGLALAKAMAKWEAGREFPLSDEQWKAAQAKAFGGDAPAAVAASQGPSQVSAAAPAQPSAPTQLAQAPAQTMTDATPPGATRPNLDPRVAAMLRSSNPKIQAAGRALAMSVLQKSLAGDQMNPLQRAQTEKATTDIEKNRLDIQTAKAEMPAKAAEATLREAEAASVLEGKPSLVESGKLSAKEVADSREKSLAAIDTARRIVELRAKLDQPLGFDYETRAGAKFSKKGDVIGPWSVPAPIPSGEGSGVAGALTGVLNVPSYLLQAARNIKGQYDPQVAEINRARNEIETSLTALQGARVKELFGSQNLSDADREAAAKTVGTMTAQDAEALKRQMEVGERDSLVRINNALRKGQIKVDEVPLPVIVRGIQLGIIQRKNAPGVEVPEAALALPAPPSPPPAVTQQRQGEENLSETQRLLRALDRRQPR